MRRFIDPLAIAGATLRSVGGVSARPSPAQAAGHASRRLPAESVRQFGGSIGTRFAAILFATVGFLAIGAGSGHADDVVIGFDSWPAAAPPGSTVVVRGSKCGSVLNPWGGGPIEGTVAVRIVGDDGDAVTSHVFYTKNTIWGGHLYLPADTPAGAYSITAHCAPEQGDEFDYPPNALTVISSDSYQTAPTSGDSHGAASPALTPAISSPHSSHAVVPTSYGGGSWSATATRGGLATLVLAGVGLPLLVAYRRHRRSNTRPRQP